MVDKILNTGLEALLGDVAEVNQQTIKELDLNQIKQVERNAIICSYVLFLLQPNYGKDIKNLFNKYT